MTVTTLVAVLVAFAVFMALIWSVHRLNRYGSVHFGYEPFALPNAALMTIPTLLLVSAVSGLGGLPSVDALHTGIEPAAAIKLLIWGVSLIAMLGLLSWRTNLWIGIYGATLLSIAAPVVLMTVLFARLSR